MVKKKNFPGKTQKKNNTKARKSKAKSPASWLKAFFVALAIIIFCRLFIFQTYTVHTSSMCNTLIPGDLVIINKLNYGARMPITLLSVPFAPARYEASSSKLFVDWIKLPYLRLPGFSNIQRNDVVACNYPFDFEAPIDNKIVYLKRIIAIPGDIFMVKKNNAYINNKKANIISAQFEYRIELKSKKQLETIIDKYHLNEGSMMENTNQFTVYLTENTAAILKKEKSVKSIYRVAEKERNSDYIVYPFVEDYNWSLSNYGPIVVPQKGKPLKIDIKTIAVYKTLLENYEGKTVEILNNKVLINKLPIQQYYFKQNYYFVLDDNRDNPKDSRLWGFLPESHIIGKAGFVLASFNPAGKNISFIRWNRFFKKIEN